MSSLVTDKIVKNTKQKKTHIWSSKHDLSMEPSEYPLKTQGHEFIHPPLTADPKDHFAIKSLSLASKLALNNTVIYKQFHLLSC